MKRFASALVVLALPFLTHADSITLTDGQTIQGDLVETRAGFVLIRLPELEGEAVRRISPRRIESLEFTDQGESLEHQAQIRSKFIPLLSIQDGRILIDYLNFLISDGQPLTALSYAKLWHPKNNYTEIDIPYREVLIDSSIAANLPEQALVHAQNWLTQTPPPKSRSLPWKIQAQHYLKNGDYEKALWASLTPIAHSNQLTQKEKIALNSIAAQAYRKLGYTEHSAAYLNQSSTPLTPLHLEPKDAPF
ncbi:hypothetical protein [Pelagicoccus sp. SDUM812002]|uniref:hypothetical protein n=1 Tax=Pelagicoccus sp. SDUM812002 TaxID=3041266 RepID=UPI00280ECAB2|nr:hypothetical protein [Pelagicoccus sp. SDUM812002]MDQ8184969.1 hypothetical protein [Pelagicoccus sp. SDUM812002]